MLRKLAAALVFATGASLIALADAPFVRYASVGNSHLCSVQQLTSLPQRLDVVVLGSSRMRRGVDPAVLSASSGGRFSNVFNLARPNRDTVRNSIIVDDLLDSGRSISVLILEADIDTLRQGRWATWDWRSTTSGFAAWSDILLQTPRTLFGHADPRLILDGLREKLQQALLIGASGLAAQTIAKKAEGPIPICWRDDFDVPRPELTRARARALREIRETYQHPETQLDSFRMEQPIGRRARVELEILERIRARASAHGVQLLVVRPQGYGEPPLSPSVISELQSMIPEFRAPPERLSRRLNQSHISAHHYGPEGRALFSRWLAETALSEQSAQPR